MATSVYPNVKQYQQSLALIESSVEGERADAMFYEWLINNVPTRGLTEIEVENIKNTISSIKMDELEHNKIFKRIYKQLTNKDINPVEETFIPPSSFSEGIVKALNGELNAVKKYRMIMAGLPGNYYRDPVFNILTDELRHGSLYNYIYTTIMNTQRR